jgi:DNA replication protein DnaC
LRRIQEGANRRAAATARIKLGESTQQALTKLSQSCELDAAAAKFRQQQYEDRQRQDAFDALWQQATVPPRHARMTEDDLHGDEWMAKGQELRARVSSSGGCLLALLGPCGPGKTQLAVELIRIACGQGRRARYRKAIEYLMEIRATYGGTGRSELDVIANYHEYDLLVLDEIGERGETPWEDRQLGYLCDKRYDYLQATILISNQTRATFNAAVGMRTKDRLIETGGIVECDWPSFRVKQ